MPAHFSVAKSSHSTRLNHLATKCCEKSGLALLLQFRVFFLSFVALHISGLSIVDPFYTHKVSDQAEPG